VALVFTAAIMLAGATPVAAQTSLLDRVVGPDQLGPPVVWVPGSIAAGLFTRRIAQGARVPVVFEGISAAPDPGGLPERLDLGGLTVRAALDALVTADARYEWRLVSDAIVVRPVGAWGDEGHPLHVPANSEARGEQPYAEAFREAVSGNSIQTSDMGKLAVRVDRSRRARATSGARTALARIAELAAEGNFFVQVTDTRAATGPWLKVSTWEGEGYSIDGIPPADQAEERVR
jgi:hypothetical protein